jgi:hypothetical protein
LMGVIGRSTRLFARGIAVTFGCLKFKFKLVPLFNEQSKFYW